MKRSLVIGAALMAALVLAGCGRSATTSYKSIAAVTAYLRASTDTPVPLPVALDLAIYWTALLEAIAGAGKYVDLDLSDCTISGMTGTPGEFDPGTANTDKNKIVSLVLPDVATSIKDGDYRNPTFRGFSALKSVSGSGIDTVGGWAFYECVALTTVNLPTATDIGVAAFYNCVALTTVSLPAAMSIGVRAFLNCAALTTVNLPEATDIGRLAFYECVALTTVSLPEATTIGVDAFSNCPKLTTVTLATTDVLNAFDIQKLTTVSLPEVTTIANNTFNNYAALTTVNLPAARSIGNNAFANCAALTTVNLPAARSIGNNAFANCAALTEVTLGSTVSTLGYGMFDGITAAKTVTVKVPTLATGYGTISAIYDETSSYTENWGNGFRGRGWDGLAFTPYGSINNNITLVIQYQ